jgi:hypothetical protein
MAHINRGRMEAADRFQERPKSEWPALVRIKRDFLAVQITYDCRCLTEFIREADEVWAELGYHSLEDMIHRGLDLEPAEIEAAHAWLQANEPQSAISLEDVLRQREIGVKGQKKTKPGPGRGHKTSTNGTRLFPGTRAYALARLTRDHPALAQRVQAGELSAHRAAIEAGFRHPTLTVPADDVMHAVRKLVAHYGRAAVAKAWSDLDP